MSHVIAYHPTKGERRFAAGIWAAMGPDKQGFTEKAPMPEELQPNKNGSFAERQLHEAVERESERLEGILSDKLAANILDAIKEDEAAVAKAKKGRKPKAI